MLPFLTCKQDLSRRYLALRTVVELGDYRVQGVLEAQLFHDNADVRGLAIQFFEKREGKWSNEVLRRFLEFQPKSEEMKKDQERVRALLNKTGPTKK